MDRAHAFPVWYSRSGPPHLICSRALCPAIGFHIAVSMAAVVSSKGAPPFVISRPILAYESCFLLLGPAQLGLESRSKIDSCVCKLTSGRLNLTPATHVHLVEPQWNPMVEIQAAARVDRLDQENDVVILRYIVEESIEKVLSFIGIIVRILIPFIVDKSPTKSKDMASEADNVYLWYKR